MGKSIDPQVGQPRTLITLPRKSTESKHRIKAENLLNLKTSIKVTIPKWQNNSQVAKGFPSGKRIGQIRIAEIDEYGVGPEQQEIL